ncbi:MAG: AAA family ATPase [Planctomycetota bacterium]
MDPTEHERLIGLLRRVIRDCGKLYSKCSRLMVRRYPTLIQGNAKQFESMMDDLHRGLLVKVYVTIVRADDRWTGPEKRVAAAMIEHLWDQELHGEDLRNAAVELFAQADRLTWDSLVAPFVRYAPLADSKAHVETIVMRLANLVAKCDGQTMPEESVALHNLQQDMDAALRPANPDATLAPLPVAPLSARDARDSLPTGPASTPPHSQGPHTAQGPHAVAQQSGNPHTAAPGAAGAAPLSEEEKARRLEKAMDELNRLIGLDSVKARVKSYANFLRLQQQRRSSGLATMPISLHMSFTGNPGTGKTTVARIIGQILGAMGTLPSGHVVETDRAGLVGEYAGQTAPKTNQLCDSARGGVLFVDEAYTLADSSEDSYGREAIATLLKRMEDDRESMAVILAGYNQEMDDLLKSNPGLTSRINTHIEFDDYRPSEMGEIFEVMCKQNQYALPADARHRLLLGLTSLYEKRDRHFGNGRLARNAFEDSVRCLADRIADVTVLSEDLLTRLTAADIAVPGVSRYEIDRLMEKPHKLYRHCAKCDTRIQIEAKSLGRRVRCTVCEAVQASPWADIRWSQE